MKIEIVSLEDYNKRITIISRTISFWIEKFPGLEDFFFSKKMKPYIMSCFIISRLKKVKEEDLENFIDGLALIPTYLKSKKEEVGDEFNKSVTPVINELVNLYKSEEYQIALIDKFVVGDESIVINGISVPISRKQILNHIKRKKGFPIRQNDIDEIQKDFVEFKIKQYSNKEIKESKESKIVNFPELFSLQDQYVSEICKKVFGKKKPKDFAIMFCILTDMNFLTISNRDRANYFKSWYQFINKTLPKNNNFWSINKHIIDKAANGLVFKDETDADFINCKYVFEEELKRFSKYR